MKKVHLISIGGAVMHNLALALLEQGYTITGSDDEIFEPSASRLKAKGIFPSKMGWDPDNIHPNLDFVILGMHAKIDNPELLKAKELNIPVYSFPEYIYEQSKNKKRVVIAGSHGKTTTTAMVMHVLYTLGLPFDYLVGSQLEGFEYMVRISDAPVIIIEGDEYLTSPIDLKPKFHWYKPHVAMITGIAWDHINVFPTFENYLEQFSLFIKSIDPNGALIWFEEDQHLRLLMGDASCQTIPYGTPLYSTENEVVSWVTEQKKYPLQVFGKHNLQNMLGAMKVCEQLRISNEDFLRAISSFKGTARRLEPIKSTYFYAVFRDFAHAPSKVTATVKAVAEQFPEKKLIAVFELHTYSSLRMDFLTQYAHSLDASYKKVIYLNPHVFEMKKMPVIPHQALLDVFDNDTAIITDKDALTSLIFELRSQENVLLLMSSGNFDGLVFHV